MAREKEFIHRKYSAQMLNRTITFPDGKQISTGVDRGKDREKMWILKTEKKLSQAVVKH